MNSSVKPTPSADPQRPSPTRVLAAAFVLIFACIAAWINGSWIHSHPVWEKIGIEVAQIFSTIFVGWVTLGYVYWIATLFLSWKEESKNKSSSGQADRYPKLNDVLIPAAFGLFVIGYCLWGNMQHRGPLTLHATDPFTHGKVIFLPNAKNEVSPTESELKSYNECLTIALKPVGVAAAPSDEQVFRAHSECKKHSGYEARSRESK